MTPDPCNNALGDVDFDGLSFDIYEDPVTGATIGVPTGVDLIWNDRLNAVEMVEDRGDITFRMTIGVTRAASFEAAKAYGLDTFASAVAAVAELEEGVEGIVYETGPDYYDQYAWFSGETEGYDLATGEFADIYLDMVVLGRDFLGSALYIVGDDEAYDDADEAVATLFEIGALYLSDFSLR